MPLSEALAVIDEDRRITALGMGHLAHPARNLGPSELISGVACQAVPGW